MHTQTATYTFKQRSFALLWGLLCHSLFLISIAAMASNLFLGMQLGFGKLSGFCAITGNTALLISFPLLHSWFLSSKGRKLMAKAIPFQIGVELTTTTFAMIASIQLLVVFLLWSPSGIVWWQAGSWEIWIIGFFSVCSWLLLAKSMYDADLTLQLGLLGWSAVFLNKKPKYKPFATKGIYKHVRQPIYISFALILWFTSGWTPDQLCLAILWTGYCIVGSAVKEKRFLKIFGDSFKKYQKEVPFWIPRMRTKPSPKIDRFDFDVLIIGGGPIGLLLACLLGKRKIKTLVVESRKNLPKGSMAIGITPPSLDILKNLDLDEAFTKHGIHISKAKVFENGQLIGKLDFSDLQSDFPYILSLQQADTMSVLIEKLSTFSSVKLIREIDYVKHENAQNGVIVHLRDKHTNASINYSTKKLIGCDGNKSQVRQQEHIHFRRTFYGVEFLMADFEDNTGFGSDAHLYFGSQGSVEAFPMAHNQRRWIIQKPKDFDPNKGIAQSIIEYVKKWTGYDLSESKNYFESSFKPQRGIASVYNKGNVFLCGDAAHVMSPIGGQGMNTGFADALQLSKILLNCFSTKKENRTAYNHYNNTRRKAFSVAATRAAYGMWFGTRRGNLSSHLRKTIVQKVLFRPKIRAKLAPYFAMLTIPGNKHLQKHI